MEIKCANQVSDSIIYQVFSEGYSDYMFKFEMTLEVFCDRFLRLEAQKDLSYIAFDNDKPVGLILGDIQTYEGIKTMRCGGFAVIPTYRQKGVGRALFNCHLEAAKERGCLQLFLEVIKGNDKAIEFYHKVGYKSVHDYRLYKKILNDSQGQVSRDVVQVNFQVIKDHRLGNLDCHLNWQGDMFILEQVPGLKCYGLGQEGDWQALLAMRPSGMIHYMWVRPDKRLQGLGKTLLDHCIDDLNPQALMTVSSNKITYEGFLLHLGFERIIEQHEMILTLTRRTN